MTQDGLVTASSKNLPAADDNADLVMSLSAGLASQKMTVSELIDLQNAAAVSGASIAFSKSELQHILSHTLQQCTDTKRATKEFMQTELGQIVTAAYGRVFGAAAEDCFSSPAAQLLSIALADTEHILAPACDATSPPACMTQSVHAPLLNLHGLASRVMQLRMSSTDCFNQQHIDDITTESKVWLVADSSQPQEYVPVSLQELTRFSLWANAMWRHGRSLLVSLAVPAALLCCLVGHCLNQAHLHCTP